MRSKTIQVLLFTTVVFQHFQLLQVAGYQVTVGLISGTILVLIASNPVSLKRLTAVWTPILALTATSALVASDVSRSKFFSTLLLLLLTTLIIVAATGGLRAGLFEGNDLWRAIHLALLVVVVLSVAQTATGAMGSDALFNPFGTFQYRNEYQPHLEFNAIPRAQGFFLEPSYDAFVIGSLSVSLLCAGRYFRSTLALALVGLGVSQSATGLILFVTLALLIAIKSRPGTAIPVVLTAIVLLAYLGQSLLGRIDSIEVAGSSGNYRLIAPLRVLGDVLLLHPLGLPLGSIQSVLDTYGLRMDGVAGNMTSLDNGVYVVIFYFGWLGLILLGGLVLWAVKHARSPTMYNGVGRYEWIAPAWLFGSLLFSGGIVAPEFGLMTWLVVSSFRGACKQKGLQLENRTTIAKRDHRHISRPAGT